MACTDLSQSLQQKNKWEIRFGPAQAYHKAYRSSMNRESGFGLYSYHKAYRSSMNGESGFGLYRVITKLTAVVNRE